MKKLILSTLVLLFIIGILMNQAKAQSVEFGIRSGLNISSFAGSKQEVDSPRIGLLAGLYGKINIPVIPLSVQPEVLYSQKGAEINGVESRLDYIEIPILARIDIATAGSLTPHIYAGPYFAFNINAEEEPESDLGPLEDVTNENDFGLTVGVGADINKVNVGIRYSLGLAEVFENEEERNQVVSIVAGIAF